MNWRKKNHYLSRFYLEGFCNQDAKVWTYPKADSNNPLARPPEKTAITNKLYHLDLDGINKKYTVDAMENYLNDEIEGPASSSFKMLREKTFPNADEKIKLSIFQVTNSYSQTLTQKN